MCEIGANGEKVVGGKRGLTWDGEEMLAGRGAAARVALGLEHKVASRVTVDISGDEHGLGREDEGDTADRLLLVPGGWVGGHRTGFVRARARRGVQ